MTIESVAERDSAVQSVTTINSNQVMDMGLLERLLEPFINTGTSCAIILLNTPDAADNAEAALAATSARKTRSEAAAIKAAEVEARKDARAEAAAAKVRAAEAERIAKAEAKAAKAKARKDAEVAVVEARKAAKAEAAKVEAAHADKDRSRLLNALWNSFGPSRFASKDILARIDDGGDELREVLGPRALGRDGRLTQRGITLVLSREHNIAAGRLLLRMKENGKTFTVFWLERVDPE